MAKTTSLAELTEVASDDLLVVVDKSDTSMADSGTDKKVQKVNLLKGLVPENGWIPAGETWTYASVDDPTGVIKINANVTSKYSEGMKLKMTNGGYTINAIITKMGTYGGDEAGYTYITFLHEIDPTDNLALHLMANSAITNPYYSTQKAPQGFPMSPAKWSVEVVDTGVRLTANPIQNTWYNISQLGLSIPIGVWNIVTNHCLYASRGSAGVADVKITLSTTNNSQSNSTHTSWLYTRAGTDGASVETQGTVSKTFLITATSKTAYYTNILTTNSGISNIGTVGSSSSCVVRATCAYL